MRQLIILACLCMFCAANTAFAAGLEELTTRIATEHDLSKKEARARIKQVFSGLEQELIASEEVLIRGFGSFYLQHRDERMARNPRTGEKITVPAKRYPKFRSSEKLKERVNHS